MSLSSNVFLMFVILFDVLLYKISIQNPKQTYDLLLCHILVLCFCLLCPIFFPYLFSRM